MRLLTDSTVDGIVTELNPDDAPIITSLDETEDGARDAVDAARNCSDEDIKDSVTIDDPETIENITLDDFSE